MLLVVYSFHNQRKDKLLGKYKPLLFSPMRLTLTQAEGRQRSITPFTAYLRTLLTVAITGLGFSIKYSRHLVIFLNFFQCGW